jgi:translation initiation factor IF-2
LVLYSGSTLKQQSAGRHVAPLGHINFISVPAIKGENIQRLLNLILKVTHKGKQKYFKAKINKNLLL